jgi:hypothetical protein
MERPANLKVEAATMPNVKAKVMFRKRQVRWWWKIVRVLTNLLRWSFIYADCYGFISSGSTLVLEWSLYLAVVRLVTSSSLSRTASDSGDALYRPTCTKKAIWKNPAQRRKYRTSL